MPVNSRDKTEYLKLFNDNEAGVISEFFASTVVIVSESITGYRGPRQPGVQHPCTHTKSVFVPCRMRWFN